jgi:hypothetical protein
VLSAGRNRKSAAAAEKKEGEAAKSKSPKPVTGS